MVPEALLHGQEGWRIGCFPLRALRSVRRLRRLLAAGAILLPFASAAHAAGAFAMHPSPLPVPAVRFEDGRGSQKTLADLRGKTLLVNVWATWCVPCRKEMPTLDRLEEKLGGPDFEVVALSIDRAGPDAVRSFFKEIGVGNLALRIDASGKTLYALGLRGLPSTLLIDPNGRELGRLIGPAKWDSPEMIAFLQTHIAKPSERN